MALVEALTGTDPDRFKEEKGREITIDLRFAFLGDNITFIDVPDHEKFVVKDTYLDRVPIVTVSNTTGEGIADLKKLTFINSLKKKTIIIKIR